MGTMVGLATEAGTIDKDGNIPNVDRVLQVDALGAIVGGVASVSSNQIFVESGAGIGEGARTGLAWPRSSPDCCSSSPCSSRR
jgi:AGZA family xanthine/uracil permease-like MFS transporter